MKKVLLFLSVSMMAFNFISCDKNDDPATDEPGKTTETSVDATSKITWHYYSFAQEKIVGSADESAENNATWAARKDWDIAIQRYMVRTNSGEFTKAEAKGGVYTFDEKTTFSSVLNIPSNIQFKTDKSITTEGHGGTTSTSVYSNATVILFKKDANGASIMPPVYLKAPVYIYRTADGNNYYKVEFTQYVNDASVSGHVKFNSAKISLK